MPAVFVHGNPETDAIWGPLLDELERDDTLCLSPPGFGAPVPGGWGATRDEYAMWLVSELERIDGPVDLVGHDWGGGHVMAVVTSRPELVRSWTSDVLGLYHADYVWHDMAQVWRTPEAGEQIVEQMMAAPVADRVAMYVGLGMTEAVAEKVVTGTDPAMGRCILALYRSAEPEDLRATDLSVASKRPGLAIVASDDPYVGTHDMHSACAQRAGARVEVLDGVGHWWMLQDPAAGAAALSTFWAEVST